MRMMRAVMVVCGVVVGGARVVEEEESRHLAMMLVDDLGYNDGWVNSTDLEEAWFRVRRELLPDAVVVKEFYTTPMCTPTRGAFLSGKYPHKLGLQHLVIQGFQDYGLPKNETTLAEKLRPKYETVHVGKWHLGSYDEASMPIQRGFDKSWGYASGMESHFGHKQLGYYDLYDSGLFSGTTSDSSGTDLYDAFSGTTISETSGTYSIGAAVYDGTDSANDAVTDYLIGAVYNGTDSAHLFNDAVERALKTRNASKKFFLYLALQDTHLPVQSAFHCDNFDDVSSDEYPSGIRKKFCGMARAADETVANATRMLDSYLGGKEASVIVLCGDNGGLVHGGGNNWPLRGQKVQPWEGGVRNHFLIRATGLLQPGVYDAGFIHIVDVHVTFLSLAGVKSSLDDDDDDESRRLDGVDFMPALLNREQHPRNEALLMYDPCSSSDVNPTSCGAAAFAYRLGRYKLVHPEDLNDTWYPPPSISNPFSPTLNAAFETGPLARCFLYDVVADPSETTDLLTQHINLSLQILDKIDAQLRFEMPPCNLPPDGACYDQDPAAEAQCARLGYWMPWITYDDDDDDSSSSSSSSSSTFPFFRVPQQDLMYASFLVAAFIAMLLLVLAADRRLSSSVKPTDCSSGRDHHKMMSSSSSSSSSPGRDARVAGIALI